MSSNRLAIAALALACIASAAAGGYLATRQNTVPTPAAAMTPTPTAPAPGTPEAATTPWTPAYACTTKAATRWMRAWLPRSRLPCANFLILVLAAKRPS